MGNKPKILIVEDEALIALDIQKRLKANGYQVVGVVSNGRDAIQSAEELSPDLILMDIVINGDIDGIEAARQIQARMFTPIVYVTAYADNLTLSRVKETSPYGYIVKPFRDNQLNSTIQIALQLSAEEKRLRDSQKWLRSVLQSIGDGVIVTDDNSRVTFLNSVAQEMVGWRIEDAFEKPLNEVFQISIDGSGEGTDWLIRRILSEGATVSIVSASLTRTKDNQKIPISDCATALRDDSGKVIGSVIVFGDASKRGQMTEALLKAKAAAETANREKTEFLSKIGHDMRVPIAGIIGMTDVTLHSTLDSDQRENLEAVKAAAGSLLNLVEDVLDFSKMESGQFHLVSVKYDLRRHIHEIVKILSLHAAQKGLIIKSAIDERIPTFVFGDPHRLRRVLFNLVQNAIKFSEKGAIELSVSLESEAKEGVSIRFLVKDHGPGISPDDLAHIFDPYIQGAQPIVTEQSGMGLGLSIASELARMMGGDIKAESELGKGSSFYFSLHLGTRRKSAKKKAEENKSDNLTEKIDNNKTNPDDSKPRFLIVDDEPIICKFLVRVLSPYARCEVAYNGRQAVDLFHHALSNGHPFRLICMDVRMPRMGGLEALTAIRKMEEERGLTKEKTAKVIMISAVKDSKTVMAAYRQGSEAFAVKPIEVEKYLQQIRSFGLIPATP
jgi:PAS domain S-box-containing protein